MRPMLLAILTMAVLATPTTAAREPQLPAKYTKLYYKVRAEHGKRAPGRNIRRHGVRSSRCKCTRPALKSEVAKSIRQLRRLLASAPRYLERTAVPPPQRPGNVRTPGVAAGPILARIAACESGGNPRAISPGGTYRGKYQFDYATWRSVGGSGDPAAASEAEQDRRAALLYARRGAQPWPVCGR